MVLDGYHFLVAPLRQFPCIHGLHTLLNQPGAVGSRARAVMMIINTLKQTVDA